MLGGCDLSHGLRSATEALLGKSLTSEQLVGELHALFDGELGDESLDAVTGGANTGGANTPKVAVKAAAVRGQVNRGATVADDGYVGERGPIFVKDGGFGGKGGAQI